MKHYLLGILLSLLSISVFAGEPDTSRIVGGVKSANGAWPYTVALLGTDKLNEYRGMANANYKAHFCGGTLIDPRWVLTAAHCVVDVIGGDKVTIGTSTLKVLIGTSSLLNEEDKRVDVEKIIPHPDYVKATHDFDIALIKLKKASSVLTIETSPDDPPTGLGVLAVGWGARVENLGVYTDYPYDLHEVIVPITDRATCDALYGAEFTSNMLCAGYDIGGKDACRGDSGGPLIASQNGEHVQVGITSWGIGCGRSNQYGVYTRVSQFTGWIDDTIAANTDASGGGTLHLLLLPLFLIGLLRRRYPRVRSIH